MGGTRILAQLFAQLRRAESTIEKRPFCWYWLISPSSQFPSGSSFHGRDPHEDGGVHFSRAVVNPRSPTVALSLSRNNPSPTWCLRGNRKMKDHGGNLLSQRPARSRRFITGTFDEEKRDDEEEGGGGGGGRKGKERKSKGKATTRGGVEEEERKGSETKSDRTRKPVYTRRVATREMSDRSWPSFQGVGIYRVGRTHLATDARHAAGPASIGIQPIYLATEGERGEKYLPKYPRRSRWRRWRFFGILLPAPFCLFPRTTEHRRNEFSLLLYRQSRATRLFLSCRLHVITVSRRRDPPRITHQRQIGRTG